MSYSAFSSRLLNNRVRHVQSTSCPSTGKNDNLVEYFVHFWPCAPPTIVSHVDDSKSGRGSGKVTRRCPGRRPTTDCNDAKMPRYSRKAYGCPQVLVCLSSLSDNALPSALCTNVIMSFAYLAYPAPPLTCLFPVPHLLSTFRSCILSPQIP